MLCQNCHKNEASGRYAEVVDGKVTDLALCSECLAKRQDVAGPGFEFSSPSPFVRRKRSKSSIAPDVAEKSCNACSTTLASILETGRVGCSTCYESFPGQLESLLEGIHMALTHRGKVPRLDDGRARIRAELQSKRALLKTALGLENYEEAASLRDEIRALETGLCAAEAGAD